MNIGTQFSATLAPGATGSWFTWGWPQNEFVVWSVVPISDQSEVSLEALDVQLGSAGITYLLTITNVGSQPAIFQANFAYVDF